MGRRSHSQTLHLWANGDYVGCWTVNANGDSELQYDTAWRSSQRGRAISLSMPFNLHNEPLKGASVSHYFEGLLADSDIIRKRVAARFKTGSVEAFDLLAAIGRDCVGALQLLPEGIEPEGLAQVDGIAVDEEAIERHLLEVVNPDQYGSK
ncbi:HipA N-terminal domain-containing protein [Massilia mucilaginosa]|uniref:HipA N-terminal domain-containing protein n=1 Tax=Massilia mucilaginosa TaxID=2609282 RepID=UPI003F892CB2